MINQVNLDELKFDANGLIPAVVQDVISGTVLMLAYMNKESLTKTLAEERTWFYSRSRKTLWPKGDTSGNIQRVAAIYYDCDADAILLQVHQTGTACHEGTFSCFSRVLSTAGEELSPEWDILFRVARVVEQRQKELPPGAYTTYLFEKGLDKILKKLGEEATEVVIAAKGGQKQEVICETADLLYHLLVLLRERDIELTEIWAELRRRHKK